MTSRENWSSDTEGLLDAQEPGGEAVDLLLDGVQVEAGPVRRDDAEALHQRLAAVVAGADRDGVEVEDLRDVVRVDAGDVEADDARATVGRRTPRRDPGD